MSAAWGDFDNDGFVDLVVSNEGADYLYRNNTNGSFTSITNSPLVENDSDLGAGVAFADYDNDGYLDLAVATFGGASKLFQNNGDGTFTKSVGNPPDAVGNANAVTWGNYDKDGYLDLMITMFGPANLLYRNNGDGSFAKMTSETVGSIASDTGPWVAGVWNDYDNDSDLDMFVTSGRNAFYRNNENGTFTRLFAADIGDLDDTASAPSGGAAWGDYDNDGTPFTEITATALLRR
jgi:hypothetical protein